MIAVGIATIPNREEMVQRTIKSVRENCDIIYLALNGYEKIPRWVEKDKRIKPKIFDNAIFGDAAKFWGCTFTKGYYFTCDDDLIYPEDYFEVFTKASQKFGDKAIISIHGKRCTNKLIKNFYRDTENISRCLHDQEKDIQVHIPGSGAMCMHTSYNKIDMAHFGAPNMADVWVGLYAQKNQSPIISLKHKKGWLKYQKPEGTIFRDSYNKCQLQTALINSTKWKDYSLIYTE